MRRSSICAARLFQMCGVDLTRIDGIDVTTALVVVSEVGADMRKFPSDKHFASWLGLCPGTKITGGKVMSGKTWGEWANRASQALKLEPLHCARASRHWARTTGGCVLGWTSPRPSPPPHTSSRG